MPLPDKIALCGYAGTGKDYLAECLISEGYTRIAFADSMKKFCSRILPFLDEDYPHGTKDIPLNLRYNDNTITHSPREIWQSVSTGILNVYSSFFIDETEKELKKHSKIIVTDVRRKEEFDFLKENGYNVIFIEGNTLPINEFDKLIDEFKDEIKLKFKNNYNGLQEFKQYLQNVQNLKG